MTQSVLRFAPSPNGPLHLGHAFSALSNAQMAACVDGRLLLRIEDIDVTRCRPELEQGIIDDLHWLGLTWHGKPRRQSEHFALYASALERLRHEGLIWQSFETRAEIRAARLPLDPDGAPRLAGPLLPDSERRKRQEQGAPFAYRLDMGKAMARLAQQLEWTETDDVGRPLRTIAAEPLLWGDVILARKEVPTSYHLSVVVDDAIQGISHVVRGQDLFHATSVHRLLQTLLGLPMPLYHHHRLIMDAQGRKLAKSLAATGLATLRAQGATPADIRRMVGL